MKNKKKKYIGIIVILAIIVTSIIGFKIINKDVDINPEILVSRNYEQVKKGDEAIDATEFVTFDAFYLRDLDGDGYAEKLRGSCREIGTTDTLYMDLNVLTNGTLKNAKITINGKNFYFSTALVKDSVISKDYISTNLKEIVLNDVSNGTQKLIFGMVQSGDYTYSNGIAKAIGNDTNKYSVTDNAITLTGTHVADDGTETLITKTINLTNDWYGTAEAELNSSYTSQEYNIADALDTKNSIINVKFKVNPIERKKQLIISNQHLELDVPELAGYKAINVLVDNSELEVNYDSEKGKVKLDLNANLDDNGVATKTISKDITYNVTYVYPYEAYEKADKDGFTLNIPIDAKYTGYNNPAEEFDNPYVSNVAEQVVSVLYGTPLGENAIVEIRVGEYVNGTYVISKEKPLNIYNNIENDDEEDLYTVRWEIYTGTEALNVPVIMNEPSTSYSDKFLDVNANYTEMLDYIENVGIYFENQSTLLGADGYINVYNNDTNELLHTFTKDDWNKYTKYNPYKYEIPVEHIRIETSNVLKTAKLYVYNVKLIDDVKLTTDYTEEQFDVLNEIYSYVEGYMKLEDGEMFKLDEASAYAKYQEPYSQAYLSINENYISNQETKKGVIFNITTDSNEYVKKKWQNGEFLIKYPSEIIDVKVNSVTSEDSNVTITGVDTYEENGNIYTKIYTLNETAKDLDIKINADITADPRVETMTRSIEMYYYNAACSNYYSSSRAEDIYDINGNENVAEYVGHTSISTNIVAPSNLLTSQTATDFDDIGSIVIAPQEATVDKVDGTKTARVNINITNNYSNTISEVKIVGKIPFEGNTYQINGADIGSIFDTTMTSEGIVVPEELKEYTTIYYSYNEKVTEDINSKRNGWTKAPEDMSQVKSFLIDLGDYVMPVDNTKTFNYTIQIPSGLNYNEVSYSAHAVYYCLDTDEGKLQTQTEPNKLGFRIAQKYDLEITKYETNSSKVVPGVVFSAQEVGAEETKTATTYSSGIATIKNLYVEREYIIKEIKTNSNYILDTAETKIIGHIVDGEFQLEILEGGFKTTPTIEIIENANTKVKVSLENEVKYNFVLNKTQTGTNDAIQGIRFEITDNSGSVKRYTTNANGQLTIKLLEPNVQYTLTETESQGHYLKDAVTFMMVRDENNNLKFNVLAGDLETLPVINQTGEVPVVTAGLENEKIPTYSLRITKKETDTETTIAGAQFKLIGENKADNVLYTTDGNGVIQIDNLYQYIEGKNVTGEYSLKEIYPTEGYVLNSTPIIFKATKNATNNLIFEIIGGTIREAIEDVVVDNTNPDNPIINITIDNDPVFTLTKVDAETGEPLEGVEFEITDMNGNYVRDANGKIVGANEITEIELESDGEYPWIQNEDGVWQSGNYHVRGSYSKLTSNDFYIKEKGILTFDWSVSSQGRYYDYLYYTIIDLDNPDNTIGGTDTRIGGIYGNEYENLRYVTKEIEIQPGNYRIEFVYQKNYSTDQGLDRGFIKNISVRDETKTVKTDSNGKIRLSLKEGLYQAREVKTLEGYSLPDNYTGIGIGESKEAIYNLKYEWEVGNTSIDISDMDCIEGGFVVIGNTIGAYNAEILRYDKEGNIIWKKSMNDSSFESATIVKDGIIVVGNKGEMSRNALIAKYDFDGDLVWENYENIHNFYEKVITVEDGVIVVTHAGYIVKYDLEGKMIWEISTEYDYYSISLVKDGFIVSSSRSENITAKYDFNGTLIWERNENCPKIYEVENDFITLRDSEIIRYDENGKVIWQTDSYNYYVDITIINDGIIALDRDDYIVKYDFNGECIWEKNINNYYEGQHYYSGYLYRDIIKIEDGFIISCDDGEIIKCNFEGEKIWNSIEKTYTYVDMVLLEDGVIAVDRNGKLVKYNFNGEVIWENTEKRYSYSAITSVEDGVIVVADYGEIVKYDFEGNIIWENEENIYEHCYYNDVVAVEDGMIVVGYEPDDEISVRNKIVKIDFDGNIVWEVSLDAGSNYMEYISILKIEDGIIAIGDDGEVLKCDFNGNIVWENKEKKGCYYYDAKLASDGIIALGDDLVKYDFDGNILWESSTVVYAHNEVVVVNDGIITVGARGEIDKYDFDGNLISRNEEKSYYYTSAVAVEDGIIAVTKEGLVLKFKNNILEPEIPQANNVIIKNEIAKYKITTRVEGYGGYISGENEEPYEVVKHKENSTKDIIIIPKDGYKVQTITINGKKIDYKENEDDTVNIEKFISMTEDKEVIVSFVKKDTTLIIKKVDGISNSLLSDAKFNIKQIETREEPLKELVIGEIVADGEEYVSEKIVLGEKIENVVGNIIANNSYYFVEENGVYVSNNVGIDNTTANSYLEINLSDYTGKYAVVVNANISSESGYDYGYATITQSNIAPTHNEAQGQFMKISGTSSSVTIPKDYMMTLDGGYVYYLHLGYRKDSGGYRGNDKVTINSINICSATTQTVTNTYYFKENGNGGYESNNQGQANTVASSYIPIKLEGYEGKYNLTVNANVSSQSSDYGYARITTDKNKNTGRFISLSGTYTSSITPTDYTTILEGGNNYYLHLGYSKNASGDEGEDKFTINSINIQLNQDSYIDTDITTNSFGEATIELEDAKYQITEVRAPSGYTLNSTPIIYDFVSGKDNIITIKNNPQVDVLVHHYIKNTTISVAPDEYIMGELGKEYSTQPKTDLIEYKLVKNEDGTYQIPDNAIGTFTEETQVVTYYYEIAPVQLIVHHYIDGTEDSVAPDEITEWEYGTEYSTNPVEYPILAENYELVTTKLPENASGTLDDLVTEVTYYYKIKEHKITTEVDGVGGTISGEGEAPYETVIHSENSIKDILVTPNDGYEIKSITINGIEQLLPEDKKSAYILDKFIDVIEDKHVIVSFEIEKSNFTITKIWEDNENELGKRPEGIEVQLYNGKELVANEILNKEMVVMERIKQDVIFNQISEIYPWYQNDDGTWQSGNYNVDYSSSTLKSDIIEVSKENALLSFEWSVSSESEYYDYLYYMLFDIENNTIVSNDFIGGEYYGTSYEELKYTKVNIELVPGKYQIQFVYEKDESVSSGLDSGFIRNIIVETDEYMPIEKQWRYTFRVPLKDSSGNKINYSVVEKEVNTNDLCLYTSEIVYVENGATIKNVFGIPDTKMNLEVVKKWSDNNNANSRRPDQIKLQLKTGENVLQEQVLDVTTENTQSYTFTDLPEYDENGNIIEYTIDEVEVNTDDLKFYTKTVNNKTYTITNTFTVPEDKVSVDVTKKWEDNSNANNVRPTQITLQVKNGDEVVQEQTVDVTSENEKVYTFENLAKYDVNGQEIVYAADEKEVEGYTKITDGTTVINTIKLYKITTEVDGEGGAITGEGETPYETVVHGENSVKDIAVTPDAGYKITSITVNGEPITFTPDSEDDYTLDKFVNMTEDKHIVVKFEKKDTSIIVKHQTEDGNDLVEPETVNGKVGDTYTTTEKDFEDYEIKTVPDNANGTMTEEQIEVIYVYSLVKGKITVTKVDINNTNAKLEGATFKLEKLDNDGNVDTAFTVQEKTTGSEGTVEFSELLVGKYQITETKAPEGYELNTEVTEAEILKDTREIDFVIKNSKKEEAPATGDIQITILGMIAIISSIGIMYILNTKKILKK